MAPAKKPTQGERIVTIETKQSNDRKEIDDMHDEIKQMDVKLDGMVLSFATFKAKAPQLIGDYLADLASERNRKWLMFAVIAGTCITLASLIVAIVAVMR